MKDPPACQRLDISCKGCFYFGLGYTWAGMLINLNRYLQSLAALLGPVLTLQSRVLEVQKRVGETPWGHRCLPTRRDTHWPIPVTACWRGGLRHPQTLSLCLHWYPCYSDLHGALWEKQREAFSHGVGALFISRTQSAAGYQTTSGESALSFTPAFPSQRLPDAYGQGEGGRGASSICCLQSLLFRDWSRLSDRGSKVEGQWCPPSS